MPYPYVTPSGLSDPNVYNLGEFARFDFGFDFCFYDSVFQSMLLSSYGLISFETGMAGCNLNGGAFIPIPSAAGDDCEQSFYYPKATVFGCYTFLSPLLENNFGMPVASPADRKIEWRIEGTAPCRKIIASYYHIGSLFNADCSLANPATFQMVLYESTGLIEIYIENYFCPELIETGKAICGIQNWNRDKGIAPPGKNATIWTAHNEAFRFTPSGGSSRFISSQLYSLSGNLVATADTSTNTADSALLNIQFNNVCTTADTTKYILQTSYIGCPTGNTITSTDTITIIKKQLNPVVSNSNGILQTTPFSTYQWLLEGNAIPNATQQTYAATQSGYYQVVVTDSAGCIDTSALYNYTTTPVTLLSFTARYNGSNTNILNWQTSQEINSRHFTVQRSYQLPYFTNIATLPAAGNSSILKSYTLTDSNILYQPTFYRLQQTDIDGRWQYSNTVMVHPVKNKFYISAVYPNPASNVLTIEYNSISAQPVTLLITDMLGRLVHQSNLPSVAGFNKAAINTSSFASGKYVLRLYNERGNEMEVFVKY